MISYEHPKAAEVAEVQWYMPPSPPAGPFCAGEATKEEINAYLDDLAWSMTLRPAVAVVQAPTLADRFREHAERWQRETAHLSSTAKIILHPSYQAIMAMGPDVIPLLLRDLHQNRRSWFWALEHLTGENPVQPSDIGKVDRVIAAWLKWGKERHRI